MLLLSAKEKIRPRLLKENLLGKKIVVRAKVLSAEEAIGNPERDDFPLLKGREKIMEANFQGHRGHAFTDMYGGFEGTIDELFAMPLNNNYRRALLVATINALSSYWSLVGGTVHCRDDQPQICARKCLEHFQQEFPSVKKIALVGFQPALAEEFSRQYALKILDLSKDNIGEEKFGVRILDGQKDMASAARWSDIVLATGSTVVNGTLEDILQAAGGSKKVILYGVTISGVAYWMDLPRVCFVE